MTNITYVYPTVRTAHALFLLQTSARRCADKALDLDIGIPRETFQTLLFTKMLIYLQYGGPLR